MAEFLIGTLGTRGLQGCLVANRRLLIVDCVVNLTAVSARKTEKSVQRREWKDQALYAL